MSFLVAIIFIRVFYRAQSIFYSGGGNKDLLTLWCGCVHILALQGRYRRYYRGAALWVYLPPATQATHGVAHTGNAWCGPHRQRMVWPLQATQCGSRRQRMVWPLHATQWGPHRQHIVWPTQATDSVAHADNTECGPRRQHSQTLIFCVTQTRVSFKLVFWCLSIVIELKNSILFYIYIYISYIYIMIRIFLQLRG